MTGSERVCYCGRNGCDGSGPWPHANIPRADAIAMAKAVLERLLGPEVTQGFLASLADPASHPALYAPLAEALEPELAGVHMGLSTSTDVARVALATLAKMAKEH
jgi:hypothetical protein